MISDTRAGKSYFLSKLLSDILKEYIDGITCGEIRRIISGNKAINISELNEMKKN